MFHIITDAKGVFHGHILVLFGFCCVYFHSKKRENRCYQTFYGPAGILFNGGKLVVNFNGTTIDKSPCVKSHNANDVERPAIESHAYRIHDYATDNYTRLFYGPTRMHATDSGRLKAECLLLDGLVGISPRA
jgi:hypothetical protein